MSSAGGGTALCMLLKSLPDLLCTTSAVNLLQLLISEQLAENPNPAKLRSTTFTRLGLLDLLQQHFLRTDQIPYGQQMHSSALLQSRLLPPFSMSSRRCMSISYQMLYGHY